MTVRKAIMRAIRTRLREHATALEAAGRPPEANGLENRPGAQFSPADDTLAKRYAWTHGTVWFNTPPVYNAAWSIDDWIKWVDWSIPANRTALDSARVHLHEAQLADAAGTPLDPLNHELTR